MATYKIMDADALDTNLVSIASVLRSKLNSEESLTFPDDFITAINNLTFIENNNTEEDITFENDNVIVNQGYFDTSITKALPTDYVGSDITRRTSADFPVAIDSSMTELTVPAGYYENDIIVGVLL